MPKPVVLTIDPEVADVLNAATYTSTTVTLNGQLDRKLYVAVNKVLELAGGAWSKKSKRHEFSPDALAVLLQAISAGKIEDKKKTNQAYYTPAELAREVAGHADLRPGMRVLEPSAGHGALADACILVGGLSHDAIRCVELDPDACGVLGDKLYSNVWCGDFLELDPTETPPVDAVVMNPPFSDRAYLRHVMHALKFVRSGGKLVAVVPPSWRSDSTEVGKAFRSALDAQDGLDCYNVEAGAFKESGTNVATQILVVSVAAAVSPAAAAPAVRVAVSGSVRPGGGLKSRLMG